jgi:transposase InsO family protein
VHSGFGTCAPRPYRPRTNGKAERFIRTMLGGWAYGTV